MLETSALEEHCEEEGCKLEMAERGRAGAGLGSGASFGSITPPWSLFFFFWSCRVACGILVLRSGMEPVSPARKAWSLGQLTGVTSRTRLASYPRPLSPSCHAFSKPSLDVSARDPSVRAPSLSCGYLPLLLAAWALFPPPFPQLWGEDSRLSS